MTITAALKILQSEINAMGGETIVIQFIDIYKKRLKEAQALVENTRERFYIEEFIRGGITLFMLSDFETTQIITKDEFLRIARDVKYKKINYKNPEQVYVDFQDSHREYDKYYEGSWRQIEEAKKQRENKFSRMTGFLLAGYRYKDIGKWH